MHPCHHPGNSIFAAQFERQKAADLFKAGPPKHLDATRNISLPIRRFWSVLSLVKLVVCAARYPKFRSSLKVFEKTLKVLFSKGNVSIKDSNEAEVGHF